MGIVSFLILGATLALSVWAIAATVRPQFARIVDLLTNGPLPAPTLLGPVPARSALRSVRVRSVAGRLKLRAAA